MSHRGLTAVGVTPSPMYFPGDSHLALPITDKPRAALSATEPFSVDRRGVPALPQVTGNNTPSSLSDNYD